MKPNNANFGRLLGNLDGDALSAIIPKLQPLPLAHGECLSDALESIDSVYFFKTGLASVVRDAPRPVELAVIGCEGMVGWPLLLATDRYPYTITMQIAGSGWQIGADEFLALARSHPQIGTLTTRFVQALDIQMAETIFANAIGTLEIKLARWLLMCHDRVPGRELHITHDFLATMLGARRAGVTVAIHILEGNGLIRATRGVIAIVDRERLLDLAGDFYGRPEAEYERLFPT